MTQEEKAKRYDEALEKARQLCAYPTSKPFISDLQDLFPELKESEDEEIRKALIEFVQGMYMGCCTEEAGRERDMFLTWLEKQGEQNLANSAKTCKVEPKPWSEEDEKHLSWLINHLNLGGEFYDKLIDWLKSIKDRVQSQPKQEWSEEDGKVIKDICDKLNRLSMTIVGNESKVCLDDINWLKSLRPQDRWKPSEEQLECLSDAIKHYNSLGYPATKLKELLNDLKKLMEE